MHRLYILQIVLALSTHHNGQWVEGNEMEENFQWLAGHQKENQELILELHFVLVAGLHKISNRRSRVLQELKQD